MTGNLKDKKIDVVSLSIWYVTEDYYTKYEKNSYHI